MKKYKKSSLKYKNRAWVIVFTSILQLLNFMIVWVNTKASIYLFLIIFAIVGLVTEIKSDFCVVVRDTLVEYLFMFVYSIVVLSDVFSDSTVLIIAMGEISIIILGLVIIYCRYYKHALKIKLEKCANSGSSDHAFR